ncbi:unnamed protein product [Amoebophrya sp. A120]|nr:unnamed protein product [Amoebophrya sp. A120]|eukprot:GSA120T00022372001.1
MKIGSTTTMLKMSLAAAPACISFLFSSLAATPAPGVVVHAVQLTADRGEAAREAHEAAKEARRAAREAEEERLKELKEGLNDAEKTATSKKRDAEQNATSDKHEAEQKAKSDKHDAEKRAAEERQSAQQRVLSERDETNATATAVERHRKLMRWTEELCQTQGNDAIAEFLARNPLKPSSEACEEGLGSPS